MKGLGSVGEWEEPVKSKGKVGVKPKMEGGLSMIYSEPFKGNLREK